jgi:hypothetical protein
MQPIAEIIFGNIVCNVGTFYKLKINSIAMPVNVIVLDSCIGTIPKMNAIARIRFSAILGTSKCTIFDCKVPRAREIDAKEAIFNFYIFDEYIL